MKNFIKKPLSGGIPANDNKQIKNTKRKNFIFKWLKISVSVNSWLTFWEKRTLNIKSNAIK